MPNFFANLGAAAGDMLPGITTRSRARRAAREKEEQARNAASISRFQKNTNAEFARQASDLIMFGSKDKKNTQQAEQSLYDLTRQYEDPDFGASPEVITKFKMGLPKLIEDMNTRAANRTTTMTPRIGEDFERAEPELSDVGMAETKKRFGQLRSSQERGPRPDGGWEDVEKNMTLENMMALNQLGREEDDARTIADEERRVAKEEADLLAVQQRTGTAPGSATDQSAIAKDYSDIFDDIGVKYGPQVGVQKLIRTAQMKNVTVEPEDAAQWLEDYALKQWSWLGEGSAEQEKILSGTETVQILGERVLDKMQDPRTREILLDHFSRIKGIATEMEIWITGAPDTEIPPEVLQFRQALGFASDKFARVRSGAALTPYEQLFYRNIIGSQMATPQAIYTQVLGLIDQLNDERMQVYNSLSRGVYGPTMPDEIRRELPLFNSKYIRKHNDGSVSAYDPFRGGWIDTPPVFVPPYGKQGDLQSTPNGGMIIYDNGKWKRAIKNPQTGKWEPIP